MTITARRPGACAAQHEADEDQALLLANALRSSRLTVLYGSEGVGKTALLTAGVLPLLDRRLIVPPAEAEHATGAVRPFTCANEGGAAAADRTRREIGIFFDDWRAPPWPGLQAAVRQALAMPSAPAPSPVGMAQTFAAWTQPLGTRLLVILDRFEECLAGAVRRPDLRTFADDLVQSVNRPELQVNFLIALRAEAEPLMARLCRRIPGFDPHRLELAPARAETLHALPGADTDAFFERCKPSFHRLGRTPSGERRDGERGSPHRSEQAAAIVPAASFAGAVASQVSEAAPQVTEAAPPPISPEPCLARTKLDGPRWLQWLAVPVTVAGVVFLIEPAQQEDRAPSLEVAGSPTAAPGTGSAGTAAEPPAPISLAEGRPAAPLEPAAPSSPPMAAAPATPPAARNSRRPTPERPRIEIATDFSAVSDRRLAGELARSMTQAAGIEVGVLPSIDWATSLVRPPGSEPRLAIVRYDALQAARKTPAPLALEIVAPLHTDAISFLVAHDSPLRFIHEIEDRRLNIGPVRSAGGLTAASVYRHLFGKPLAPSRTRELEPQAALQELLVERSIDVMVVVGAAPAALQADGPGPGPRLLALDRSHPASRRALQAFLPATTRWPSGESAAPETPTLAVMSFLVGTAPSSDAEAERLTAFARDLCRTLPTLQCEGDPKWRSVQPALQFETGWPYSTAAATGFDTCSDPGRGERPAPAARTGLSLLTPPRRPA